MTSRIIKSLQSAIHYAQGDPTTGNRTTITVPRHLIKQGQSTLIIQFPPASMERLNALVKATDAAGESEVIATALRLYEACVKEVDKGGQVIIRRADGSEIVGMGELK